MAGHLRNAVKHLGAKRGDILVGKRPLNRGMRIRLLDDLPPMTKGILINVAIELLTEGNGNNAKFLRPHVGKQFDKAKELHDIVCERVGTKRLHFLNAGELQREDETGDVPSSAGSVLARTPKHSSFDEPAPLAPAALLEEAQHELTTEGYWKRQFEEPNLVWREIEQRRGQAAFRKNLLNAYGGKCAITGCDLEEVLEAAHIDRYIESYSNDVRNGLLLRADIHTLFDCFLIAVHPENYRIECADKLQECYDYRPLAGREIHRPDKPHHRPAKDLLKQHYEKFLDRGL